VLPSAEDFRLEKRYHSLTLTGTASVPTRDTTSRVSPSLTFGASSPALLRLPFG